MKFLLKNGGILDKYKAAIEERYGFEAGLVVTRLVKTGMIKTVLHKSAFLHHGEEENSWSLWGLSSTFKTDEFFN